MYLYTHPDCEKHELPEHPERPDRLSAVINRLAESGLADEMQTKLSVEIDDSILNLVHPQVYVDLVNKSEPKNSITRLDPDTYMSSGSLRASKLAAGACLAAATDVVEGRTDRAFCAVRPPGHHAEVAAAMGFCIFNNIAIAAETALTNPLIKRIAIADFDVHHCNGTVDIFKDRPEVMVCSSFQADYYPYRYLDFQNDHIVNCPLPKGTNSNGFRKAIETEWLPRLNDHQPDLMLISAGFDAHKRDPLGQLCLQEDDYAWVTNQLIKIASTYSQGRVISTLEGGYDLTALADSVEAHVATMMQ